MTGLEFMARLSAVIAPPRYPLVRYAGVLGPRSAWRKDIVPKPRDRQPACDGAVVDPTGGDTSGPRGKPKKDGSSKREDLRRIQTDRATRLDLRITRATAPR